MGKGGAIDIHKQLLLAISSQRIPRVDRVLDVGFRHGTGIHGMLKLIKKAADGTYHPKGFDEEEELQALLFLRLGGTRVADVAHRICGIPAVSTIRKRTMIPQITPSPSFPTSYEIGCNIAASFKAIHELLGVTTQNMLHAVIMFDEISVERRPRWDDKTNKVLGVCREHGQDTSLEFTSEQDLQTLWEELQCGKIHVAHEVGLPTSDTRHGHRINVHRSFIEGNSRCDRGSKPNITALQCASCPYLWKLQARDSQRPRWIDPGRSQCRK